MILFFFLCFGLIVAELNYELNYLPPIVRFVYYFVNLDSLLLTFLVIQIKDNQDVIQGISKLDALLKVSDF